MKIELDLSPKAVRMIKALTVLTGDTAASIEEQISQLVESSLKSRIGAELGLSEEPVVTDSRATKPVYQDTTGISDGLGDDDTDAPEEESEDDDPEITEGLKEMDALVPKSGGVSDEAMERDLEVEDPQVEAKSEPSTFGEDILKGGSEISAEDIFSQESGIPVPTPPVVEEGYEDHRVSKRKKRSRSKAIISGFTGNEL